MKIFKMGKIVLCQLNPLQKQQQQQQAFLFLSS